MATNNSSFVLVEVEGIAVADPSSPDLVMRREFIKRVLRTYESRQRAEEDTELLRDMTDNPYVFRIDEVIHVD